MGQKFGNKHVDVWGDPYECTRNKYHHGDHSNAVLRPMGKQMYWHSKHWFNNERYCGQPLMGSSYRCERAPGHKVWHKSWVFDRYIAFKVLK